MSDWKTDLANKFNIIKKEEGNGQIISSARISDRDNTRSSRDVHRVSVHKEVNNVIVKGGKGMITVEGALKDLEAIEKGTTDSGAKAIVGALKVVVKFLSTMRSNQLLTDAEKEDIRKARLARAEKEAQNKK